MSTLYESIMGVLLQEYFRRLGVMCVMGVLGGWIAGCVGGQDSVFERRSVSETGVDFSNTIVEDDSLLNPLDFEYIYNGGGVAVGDLNGDDRPDLYFAGNVVSNRLYLNRGDFRFEDVTRSAEVAARDAWSTGVTLVDINQDGLLDIYVCVGGTPELGDYRTNRLYINQGVNEGGIPLFEERATQYGIADPSYSTHAAFFDYDRDGDVDLYVLTTEMQEANRNALRRKKTRGEASNTDRLYRNNGDGTFTDVSEKAGIQIEGHGLGLAIRDVNKDGWPDIYVANDFISNDLLYVNNGDGTFTNRIDTYLKHQSYSAMGVDLADVNNDTWTDIVVLDMLPSGRKRDQMMSRFFDQSTYERSLQLGYEPQYVRNMLHVNNGRTPDGALSFSEVGSLAGLGATDWSWAPLLADFDNDGNKDLFVSNGYGRDVTNLDFVDRRQEIQAFGTRNAQQTAVRNEMQQLPNVKLSNRLFENEGDLRFADRTGEWASSPPGLSNGAAVADLDGDGDLDLVTNNINDEATILENHANDRDNANAVRVDLYGPDGNLGGLGTKLTLYRDGETQYYEHSPYRGYLSTVEPIVHFGIGADTTADSLAVVWPDGKTQTLAEVLAGQVLDVRYEEASDPQLSSSDNSASSGERDSLRFRNVAVELGLEYRHAEREINEFERTPILPHKVSKEGPGLAIGDVDGDGREDVFVGTDRGHPSVLFRQTSRGQFNRDSLSESSAYEDRGGIFFDAEGDGDQDLYVVSGGSDQAATEAVYQDRLYVNDGTGTFRRAEGALPEVSAAGSVVTAADYDADGDLDLFVGGRVRPGEYPLPPRSYLLRNDSEEGTLRFTDVTEEVAPGLVEPGLVTDALWTDYNTDGLIDLIVVGEWMPITIFENTEEGFTKKTTDAGLDETAGWWFSIAGGDFDRDGDTDYVVGNLGQNTRYEASPSAPLQVHAKDYDQNGQVDPVLTHMVDGTRYPVARREEIISQIPGLKGRFPTYEEYADAPFTEVFTEHERAGAYVREAVRFETSYLENEGDGTFVVRSLPVSVQTAPVFGLEPGDYNGDGHLDLLMVGNWYAPHVRTGRADAFIGAYLQGDGNGRFAVNKGTESGFFVDGDGKGLARVATEGGSVVLATQNEGRMEAFRPRQTDSIQVLPVRRLDRTAELHFEDGHIRRAELTYGSGYLSQSSRVLWVPRDVEKVVITNSVGKTRTLATDRHRAVVR